MALSGKLEVRKDAHVPECSKEISRVWSAPDKVRSNGEINLRLTIRAKIECQEVAVRRDFEEEREKKIWTLGYTLIC